MSGKQIAVIGGAVLLFVILLTLFDKIPPVQKALEKSRSLNVESTGLQNLLNEAMPTLDAEQKSVIDAINLDLQKADSDSAKAEILKVLSGTWYRYGFRAISGVYAEDIANIYKTEDAWSVAGTTYSLCVQSAPNEKTKSFCSKRAVRAFENAISLEPDKIAPKINLALCYVDNPDPENPMKGILMLRELDEKYPDNIQILSQLARLALKTNQTDKAKERIDRVLAIAPDYAQVYCLAADIYTASGDAAKAEEYSKKCIR
jgi:tetratricopeptide (TPR) repeat protein